jgi:hypothetical protein
VKFPLIFLSELILYYKCKAWETGPRTRRSGQMQSELDARTQCPRAFPWEASCSVGMMFAKFLAFSLLAGLICGHISKLCPEKHLGRR